MLQRCSVALGLLGLIAGCLVALGILSGDEQGRVNLLYLLALFAFLPVLGLLLSVVFLLHRAGGGAGGGGLAGWLLELPLFPAAWRRELTMASPLLRKSWLFYQTQILALAFGCGGLLAFLLLLLGSDVSFVWRSTLLQATDLYPALQALAVPWWFWTAAQPSLDLLQLSQDFRLAQPEYTARVLGQWWQYALAAQCTYNLLPRAIMLVVARSVYLHNRAGGKSAQTTVLPVSTSLNQVPASGQLAPLVTSINESYGLLDWAAAPSPCLDTITAVLGPADQHLGADPLQREPETLLPGLLPVVVVRSWEPPLAQLHDYLLHLPASRGLLLPLNWTQQGVLPPTEPHLQEWRRFAGTLENWAVLQPFTAGGTSS
ncbi:MAG: hypothetical protein RLZZ385_1941 [Pseudomonadota bacterium]|jgi:hypothetical protein